MVIDSSIVSMQSSRDYSKVESSYSEQLTSRADQAVLLEISAESKSLMEQMKEAKVDVKNNEKEAQKNRKEQQKNNLKHMLEGHKEAKGAKNVDSEDVKIKSKEELQWELVKKILESLRSLKNGKQFTSLGSEMAKYKSELKSLSFGVKSTSASSVNMKMNPASSGNAAGTGGGMTEWKVQKVTSSFIAEQEVTRFSSTGIVKTADGREINFGVSVEMSRSFMEATEIYQEGTYYLKDPLVINLDYNVAKVTDQKFYFDIDSDGKEDLVSFVDGNSGFLALDKNEDGVINNGNELFGANTGDGFKELAEYDKDENGWIDEADEVFQHLKIWMKDEKGNHVLLSLKDAGVGAIYLGYADTRFSLNQQDTNQTNAVIQKTGVYLKESGQVGTIQHIDLAV